jgi:hypothetical protein
MASRPSCPDWRLPGLYEESGGGVWNGGILLSKLQTRSPRHFRKCREFLTLTEDDPDGDEYKMVKTTRLAADGSGNFKRKIIFTTTLGTYITLPNVRLVMITGLKESSQYDPYTLSTDKVAHPLSRHEIEKMCGRFQEPQLGKVMHLYHSHRFNRLG